MSESEFDEVRRFIRLKRYEQPPPGFQESFVAEFQRRQRSELLHRSSVGLFMERVGTYVSSFGRQRLLVGAGLSYAAAMLIFFVVAREQRQPALPTASVDPSAENAAKPVSFRPPPDGRFRNASGQVKPGTMANLPGGRQPVYEPRAVEPVRYEADGVQIVEF